MEIVEEVPQCLDTERAVLACIINNPHLLPQHRLTEECFNDGRHILIWRAMAELRDAGKEVDQVTLSSKFSREDVNLVVFLGKICASMDWTVHALKDHVHRLFDFALRRQMMTAAIKLQQEAMAPSDDDLKAVNEEIFTELTQAPHHTSDIFTTKQMMPIVREEYLAAEKLARSGRRFAGLDTGFDAINEALNGLLPGELTVIAARNSVGKTTLALQMALSVSDTAPVGVFSLEMTPSQINGRLASLHSGVDPWFQRRGLLKDEPRARFMEATETIENQPIKCYPGTSVAQFRAQIKRNPDTKLWIIDHLHRMKGPGKDKYERYSDIAEGLANLALEFNVPIVLLAQLNRQCEARPDRRPEMADLRDCGTVEECAVNLALIYRPGRYQDLVEKFEKKLKSEHLTQEQIEEQMYMYQSSVQLLFEKCRFEGTCTKKIGWNNQRGYFVNAD